MPRTSRQRLHLVVHQVLNGQRLHHVRLQLMVGGGWEGSRSSVRREQGRGAASWCAMGSGFQIRHPLCFMVVGKGVRATPVQLNAPPTAATCAALAAPHQCAFAHQPTASRQSSMHCQRQHTWKPGCRYESRMRLCSRSRTYTGRGGRQGGACQHLQAAGSEGEGFPSGCKGAPDPPAMLTTQPNAQGAGGRLL